MRDIAALVFGGERAERSEAGQPSEHRDIWGEQYPEPGDWCQTQPGRTALSWLGATLSARRTRAGAARRGRGRP
jgi:hypothetical protein